MERKNNPFLTLTYMLKDTKFQFILKWNLKNNSHNVKSNSISSLELTVLFVNMVSWWVRFCKILFGQFIWTTEFKRLGTWTYFILEIYPKHFFGCLKVPRC